MPVWFFRDNERQVNYGNYRTEEVLRQLMSSAIAKSTVPWNKVLAAEKRLSPTDRYRAENNTLCSKQQNNDRLKRAGPHLFNEMHRLCQNLQPEVPFLQKLEKAVGDSNPLKNCQNTVGSPMRISASLHNVTLYEPQKVQRKICNFDQKSDTHFSEKKIVRISITNQFASKALSLSHSQFLATS
ncbi:hypothetical protein ACU8KH_06658 [Lachancea thermotolerans]